MAEEQKPGELADKLVGDIRKDFTIVGKTRVRAWYAWAIIGVVAGMFLGILYVANRSGQFDTGKAFFGEPELMGVLDDQNRSELRFVSPENNSEGDTNPVLVVQSLNVDGTPSRDLLQFDYAIEGSENWKTLPGEYNIGSYEPGRFTFVPSVFSSHLVELQDIAMDDGGTFTPVELQPPVPEGQYVIRVTRNNKDEQEEGNFIEPIDGSAQIIKPILMRPIFDPTLPPAPTAFLKFNFFPKEELSTPADRRLCKCDKIEFEHKTSIPIDSYFLPIVKEIFEKPPTNLNQLAYIKPSDPGALVAKYLFQIKASLSPDTTDAGYCSEEQGVQAKLTLLEGEPDEVNLVNTNTLNEFVDEKQIVANVKVGKPVETFPLGGDKWGPDDYRWPSVIKYHSPPQAPVANPPIIRWFDAPGFGNLSGGNLPAKYEAWFKHVVRGPDQWGDLIGWYTPVRGGSLYNYRIEVIPGKSCSCTSHITIKVNKDATLVDFLVSSECASENGGKAGTLNFSPGLTGSQDDLK